MITHDRYTADPVISIYYTVTDRGLHVYRYMVARVQGASELTLSKVHINF